MGYTKKYFWFLQIFTLYFTYSCKDFITPQYYHYIYHHQYYLALHFVSDVIMADTILVIMGHYFKLSLRAAEAVCRIWEEERNETISNCTVLNRLKHLKTSLEIKPWSIWSSVFDYDAFKGKVE